MFWLSNQVAVSEFARAFWRSLLVGCALWEGCGHGRKDLCQLALAARLPPKLRTVHSDMMLLSKLIWTQSGVSYNICVLICRAPQNRLSLKRLGDGILLSPISNLFSQTASSYKLPVKQTISFSTHCLGPEMVQEVLKYGQKC
eukprot:scaffold73315_cov18-Tisochrysis_lutea.AAC.1